MAERTVPAFECDHMRPVVRDDGAWWHVLPDGLLGGECSAGVYKVTATYEGEHVLSQLDLREKRQTEPLDDATPDVAEDTTTFEALLTGLIRTLVSELGLTRAVDGTWWVDDWQHLVVLDEDQRALLDMACFGDEDISDEGVENGGGQ